MQGGGHLRRGPAGGRVLESSRGRLSEQSTAGNARLGLAGSGSPAAGSTSPILHSLYPPAPILRSLPQAVPSQAEQAFKQFKARKEAAGQQSVQSVKDKYGDVGAAVSGHARPPARPRAAPRPWLQKSRWCFCTAVAGWLAGWLAESIVRSPSWRSSEACWPAHERMGAARRLGSAESRCLWCQAAHVVACPLAGRWSTH